MSNLFFIKSLIVDGKQLRDSSANNYLNHILPFKLEVCKAVEFGGGNLFYLIDITIHRCKIST